MSVCPSILVGLPPPTSSSLIFIFTIYNIKNNFMDMNEAIDAAGARWAGGWEVS